ncbi:MAG: patatin [Flavobacteriaceae bacterium]|nr:patatin [Flavobacteriaceae bacterium]
MESKPKRILALDGGGIRGALTLGFLERLEELLHQRTGNRNLLLCDHFDLIGGTSTGAIIAAGLSIGMTASEIKDLYLSIGDKIFGEKYSLIRNFGKRIRAEYNFGPLEKALEDVFGTLTIESKEIRTGLCIVTKRADTLSTWPIMNHPSGKFFESNKNILLRNAVRASAAAPSYFLPKQIEVGNNQMATFIDGGVSLANNPALQLFLIATLKEFPYRWPLGEDKLSILSLGTGTYTKRYEHAKMAKKHLLGWAKIIPELFMEDANYFNQTILQYISNSPTAKNIDSEILDLRDDLLTDKPALHYVRYNVLLEAKELNSLGLYFDQDQIESLRKMDAAKNKEILYNIGAKAAARDMDPAHLI